MSVLLLALLFLGPFVVVAFSIGAERRRIAALLEPEVRGGWADEPENEMHRATSPVRLAAVRAVLVGGAFALPAALLAGASDLTRGHVAWVVVAAHAGLGVACAAFLERRAAARRRPTAGALQSGLVSLIAVTIGVYQCDAAAATLLGGGPADGLAVHAETVARLTRDPIGFALGGAGVLLVVALTWALPFAAMTFERLRPGEAPVFVLVTLFTLALGLPAALTLAACFTLASGVERRLARRRRP